MAVLISRNSRTYQAGSRTITSSNAPTGVELVVLTLSREGTWPSTSDIVITMNIELSLDGGATWREWCGFSLAGGTLYGKDSVPVNYGRMSIPLPEPTNSQRRLRLTVANTVALTTAITVEVF